MNPLLAQVPPKSSTLLNVFLCVPATDHEGIPATWGADNYVAAIKQFVLQYTPTQ